MKFFWLILMVVICRVEAQHRHLNAGARSGTAGSELGFINGATFNSASGFLVRLNATNHPVYGPIFFGGGDLTLTSLPATIDFGGPAAGAASLGTSIAAQVVSVEGPDGGEFAFWDSFDGFFDATEITFRTSSGTTNGTKFFKLSENNGEPEADPYGHIHGRKFSVNKPGLYTVGLKLIDLAGNGIGMGSGAGPRHSASEPFLLNFQAGTTIYRLNRVEGGISVTYGTESGKSYTLESSPKLGEETSWQKVSGPHPGTGRLETIAGIPAAEASRFFRLRVE